MFYILYYVITTVIAGILIIRKVDPAEPCSHDVTCRILALSDNYQFRQVKPPVCAEYGTVR